MSEVSDRYSTIADGFTARVAAVPADRWSAPTPCPDWSVRATVAHVIDAHYRVMSILDKSVPPVVTEDDDVREKWQTATTAMRETISGEATSTEVKTFFGDMPFEWLVSRLVCADTLIHTWDLARATGQDERLDAGAVAAAMELLLPFDEKMRRPGGFAPKIEPAQHADEQTRLLNFCGRVV